MLNKIMQMSSSGSCDIAGQVQAGDIPPDLTEEEKCKLEEVMRKAKEFEADEENKMRKPIEGLLCKYTNVMKGWQYRWFVLTPETGMVEYYMMDDTKRTRPRGALHLAGSVISPSEEDNQSFAITSVCGEVFRLKACDAKERQFWVNRLRVTAESHTDVAERKCSSSLKDPQTGLHQGDVTLHRPVNYRNLPNASEMHAEIQPNAGRNEPLAPNISCVTNISTLGDSLVSVKQTLDEALKKQQSLVKFIEDLPCDGPHLKCVDSSLLLLKATSQATVQCLEQCYITLQQRHLATVFPIGLPPGTTVEWVDKYKPLNVVSNKGTLGSTGLVLS